MENIWAGNSSHSILSLNGQQLTSPKGILLQPNPQYKYAYQVSDEGFQTYIAHEENRDGENVSGQYSYVDPLGSLITVRYLVPIAFDYLFAHIS